MREEDATRLLAENGLRASATVQHINCWSCYFPYHGSPSGIDYLWLEFRQKHSPAGVMMTTNQFGVRHAVPTNGILHAAMLANVQIARKDAKPPTLKGW